MQKEYIRRVFPHLMSYLRTDTTCGVFLILGNDGDHTQALDYQGFFLRDSLILPQRRNQIRTFFLNEVTRIWQEMAGLRWTVHGIPPFILPAVGSGWRMISFIHHI